MALQIPEKKIFHLIWPKKEEHAVVSQNIRIDVKIIFQNLWQINHAVEAVICPCSPRFWSRTFVVNIFVLFLLFFFVCFHYKNQICLFVKYNIIVGLFLSWARTFSNGHFCNLWQNFLFRLGFRGVCSEKCCVTISDGFGSLCIHLWAAIKTFSWLLFKWDKEINQR